MPNRGQSSVSQRFHVLAVEVSRFFKQHGYKVRGQTYWYPTPEVSRVVLLGRSRWNTKQECNFSFTVGVFVPRFYTYLTGNPDPGYPNAQSLVVALGIESIPERPCQRTTLSWTIRLDDSLQKEARLLKRILSELEKWAIPFLARFNTISDVIDYLVSVRDNKDQCERFPTRPNDVWLPIYLAILHHLRGETVLAEQELERAAGAVEAGAYFLQQLSQIRERFYTLKK